MKWPYVFNVTEYMKDFYNQLIGLFKNVGDDMQEQKSRVDNLVQNAPQPSEVVDIRTAQDGTVYPTARDRIAADRNALQDNIDQNKTDQGTINTGFTSQLAETANPAHNAGGIIFGREYMSYFHKKLMAWNVLSDGQALNLLKVIFSGDSTTAGDSTSSSAFHIDQLIKNLSLQNGLLMTNVINAGHSGKDTEHWNQTYVAQDLAQTPDLYIPRWGINDPYYAHTDNSALPDQSSVNPSIDVLRRTPEDFNISLRAGLQQIRNQRDYTQLTIILMAPNATYDVPNGRDAKWYEAIIPYIKQAARDYQCVFINTYQYLYDAQNAADNMDNPYGDGRHIHPNDVRNLWIANLIFDVIFPKSIRDMYGLSQIKSSLSTIDGILTGNEPPSFFPFGLSFYRVSGSGALYNGGLMTLKSADNVVYQLNVGYHTDNEIASRLRNGGYGSDTWGVWSSNSIINRPALQNSWQDYSAGVSQAEYYISRDNQVHFQGLIKPGTTTAGTILFNIPAGFRPYIDRWFLVDSNGGTCRVTVSPGGNVVLQSGTPTTYLSLDQISYLATN
ncbi:SGNH/GDSL hydrolase family protein [Sporolactobacillus sp. CQH2019]|uniref:SGNH/GDSL hydrolase family protein n=1 Tax=Sporolactobacillus sp. CQH2019 TaxID=3023512 RepID=UPI0023685BE0|nr:SGNH/GDSL hydrolase family protein [Sporolactobacillus sp. CQH2019]MDD9148165.1 SGNH/GDSL hydrolase family protein [Sporolactobacillus sp. CQH2019]